MLMLEQVGLLHERGHVAKHSKSEFVHMLTTPLHEVVKTPPA